MQFGCGFGTGCFTDGYWLKFGQHIGCELFGSSADSYRTISAEVNCDPLHIIFTIMPVPSGMGCFWLGNPDPDLLFATQVACPDAFTVTITE